jgi:hypothetical protein
LKQYYAELWANNRQTRRTQSAAYSACTYRRQRFEDEVTFLTHLRESNEMQADVISRRPVYNEDILLLGMQHSSYRSKIVSAVGDSNSAHLVIFSTAEGRRACLKKVYSLAHELVSCLNPSGESAVRVKVWYFPGRFRPQVSGHGRGPIQVLAPGPGPGCFPLEA